MKLNFGILVRREPRLLDLLVESSQVVTKGMSPAQVSDIWYKSFKPRMERLVGSYIETNDPVLCTSQAYDMAYETIRGCLG